MDVATEQLFGRGVRYEFITQAGVRITIHAARDGHFELYTYSADDPDTALLRLRLTAGEARTVATIFGAQAYQG